MSRRAKIVCTLGPSTSSPERLSDLIAAGMDVARLNLSHGSHAIHAASVTMVRRTAVAQGRSVGIMADLQGPKIRLGTFECGPVPLVVGDELTITTEDVVGTPTLVSTTYEGLPVDVREGTKILVDDGRITLEVMSVHGPRVHTRVLEGGTVSDNKGLNLPGVAVTAPALTDKDAADLRWALTAGVDMVALSFVRSPSDILAVHAIMDECGVRRPVIAKIEKPQAVERLAEIIEAFDGIMVARGDLGVELPLEQVPIVQKRAAALARKHAKPVIVATQVLDSMIHASRPTRAEASDCANAVLDGADALMLSGETSVGDFPVESVATMSRIITTVEEQALESIPAIPGEPRTLGGAIGRAAAAVGTTLGARYLVAFTQTGDSARRLSRYRSAIPLLAFTPEETTRNQLALSWGVETFLVPTVFHTDDMVRQVDRSLLELDRCKIGDLVVIVAGSPPGIPGSTNTLRVHRIGDAVTGAVPAYG